MKKHSTRKLSLSRQTLADLRAATGGADGDPVTIKTAPISVSMFTCTVTIGCSRANCPSVDNCPSQDTRCTQCEA